MIDQKITAPEIQHPAELETCMLQYTLMVCVIFNCQCQQSFKYSPSRANIHWTGDRFALNVCSHFGSFVAWFIILF